MPYIKFASKNVAVRHEKLEMVLLFLGIAVAQEADLANLWWKVLKGTE